MLTFKVLSALLSYPQAEMLEALEDMTGVIEQDDILPPRDKSATLHLLREFADTDLLELQERYVNLFDHGRALSLHIFEHVHGESRDRGQAMVDLMEYYRAHGFEITVKELPDYIPLFLEYLSQRPLEETCALLSDAIPILSLLGARLRERGSSYHVLFNALEKIAGTPENLEEIKKTAANEGPDETLIHMDKIWEEEPVIFTPITGGCQAPPSPTVAPVQWVGRQPKNASL